MRSLSSAFILSMILTACSSNSVEFLDGPELVKHQIRCCQAAITTGDSIGHSKNMTRGWNEISGDQYPYESIYILSDIEDDEYKPVKDDKVVHMSVMQNPGISSADMCFKYDPESSGDPSDPEDDVFITIGDKTLEVEDCIFSSVADGTAAMDISSIKTPGGQTVYEPYGDKLFFSDFFEAEYKHGKLRLEIEGKDENGREYEEKVDIKSDEHLNIPLKRYTASIENKLIISNLIFGQNSLSTEEFEDIFGSLTEWSVRIFINNVPTTFNYSNMYRYPKGNDIIALSKDELSFTSGLTHDSKTGVGVIDNSEPFIFPFYDNKTEICYSFYYRPQGTPKKIQVGFTKREILPHTTIRIPIDSGTNPVSKLKANYKYYMTHLIDVEDFKRGVTGKYDRRSRGMVENDPVWGYVVEIPCKTLVEIKK